MIMFEKLKHVITNIKIFEIPWMEWIKPNTDIYHFFLTKWTNIIVNIILKLFVLNDDDLSFSTNCS